MTKFTMNFFANVFGQSANKFDREMLTYAKTEYGKDWQYAYQFMLTHKGKGPRMGVNI
jgi:hypothetical protein